MNSIHYLQAAYAATWTIHVIYMSILYRRYRKLRREVDQLTGK